MIKKLFLVTLMLLSVYVTMAQANTPPTLSNFRIDNSNKNRVYFDSSEQITASTTSGFIISGKTISSITINSSSTTGHYFTVNSSFTFWDNNTIRYEGGSNMQDNSGNPLSDFTLTHIINYINEPTSEIIRYASASGSGSRNGTSEENSWSYYEAFQKATAGMTVYMKAGTSDADLVVSNSGKVNNPIKFIGYKSTPNDITSNYYNNGLTDAVDATEMPTLNNGDRSTGTGIYSNNPDYIIIKNMNITNYNSGVSITDNIGLVLERINTVTIGKVTAYRSGIALYGTWDKTTAPATFKDSKARIVDCRVKDATGNGILANGHGVLVDRAKVWAIEGIGDYHIAMDYSITGRGNHLIFANNYIYRNPNNAHGNYFGFKSEEDGWNGKPDGVNVPTMYGLAYGNETVNIFRALKARNVGTDYCVFKYNIVRNGNISIFGGVKYNVWENNYLENGSQAINLYNNVESIRSGKVSEGNIIRNNIFNNFNYFIYASSEETNTIAYNNNKFYNNTLYKIDYLHRLLTNGGPQTFSGNEYKNNIFHSVGVLDNLALAQSSTNGKFVFDNNNFYNGFTAQGTNPNTQNPQFIDAAAANFRLNSASKLIDAGINLKEVSLDYDGNGRYQGNSTDLGAFEYNDNSTSSINANAGPDVLICNGESATLTATGGTSYVWNTGATTASINVSPSVTTTYTVTVSNGVDSDSDIVVVTVNEAPTVNAGSDISLCYGEAVTLTANGIGDFLWSNGETTPSITVNPTENTTYTVIASNSCGIEVTDDVIVTVTPGINLTVNDDITVCIGETDITLTANSNGDFLWSTGETTSSITVNPNNTTTYTVTSTLGDCSKTDEVTVTVNEAPTVNAGSDVSLCYGEAVTLTANGIGDFLWSNGETTPSITVNPTENTIYNVIASNSCGSEVTDEVLVIVNQSPTLNVSDDVTIENGSSIVLTASGNGDYLWSTGETTANITVSPTSTTTYSVILRSNEGCTSENNIVVTVENTETNTVNADAGPDVDICKGESVTLTASGGDSYLWSTGEVTPSITVSPTQTTTYTVTVSNGNAVDVDDIMVYVDETCSGISNRNITQELKVFPNPTNGLLNIELTGYSNELNIDLYSLRGRMIYSENLNDNSTDKVLSRQINLSRYGKGVYFVRITNNGDSETKKVLVL